jgi:hypothetical protein
MLFHKLLAEHKAGPPVVMLVFLITLFNHFQGRIQRHAAGIIFEQLAVLSRTAPG